MRLISCGMVCKKKNKNKQTKKKHDLFQSDFLYETKIICVLCELYSTQCNPVSHTIQFRNSECKKLKCIKSAWYCCLHVPTVPRSIYQIILILKSCYPLVSVVPRPQTLSIEFCLYTLVSQCWRYVSTIRPIKLKPVYLPHIDLVSPCLCMYLA